MKNKNEYLSFRKQIPVISEFKSFEDNAIQLIENYKNLIGPISEQQNIEDVNMHIAKLLYSTSLYEMLSKGLYDNVDELSQRNIKLLTQEKKSLISQLDFSKIQMLVIRPEAMFLKDSILNFLSKKGFKIINFREYWGLYNHGLITKDGFTDFPTRTLIYLSGVSEILVLENDSNMTQEDFNCAYKGTRGTYVPETIRGDVLFTGFVNAQYKNPELFYKYMDPLKIYRSIVNGSIDSDKEHEQYANPFLFYAGSGVHTPEEDELERDFSILLTKEDILKIIEKQNNYE